MRWQNPHPWVPEEKHNRLATVVREESEGGADKAIFAEPEEAPKPAPSEAPTEM